MNDEGTCWVVLDARGDLIAEAESHHEAVEWCRQQGLVPVADEIEDLEEFKDQTLPVAANAAARVVDEGPQGDSLLALRLSGVSPIPEQDFMDHAVTDHAWEVMRDYFPDVRSDKSKPLKYRQRPSELWGAWLGGNVKLDAPAQHGGPAHMTSLSLLPYTRWLSAMRELHEGDGQLRFANAPYPAPDQKWRRRFVELTESSYRSRLRRVGPALRARYNLCARSTPACREGCLVETGSNTAGAHNLVKKLVLTTMLHLHPQEFAVMLARRVLQHEVGSRKKTTQHKPGEPMVRFNCYSDLPWEWIVPWMFEAFSAESEHPVTFYDYTKLCGRAPKATENYDLTFSFALSNLLDCWREVQQGARVAVVFAQNNLPPVGGSFLLPNPTTRDDRDGLLLPVVSGTEDDARSRDPEQCLVALKWKPPRRYQGDASAFIVRAKKIGRYYAMDAHLPSRTHVEEREED